jgi:tripartite-type tricarboxylate transporter receptor subunit TctC
MSDATQSKYTIVHYKGSGQASIDVIAGQVPAQVDQLNSAIGHIKAGKLRAIAVTSDKRIADLPDVPTVKESGIPELKDFTYATFTGLFGPAKMPPEVVKKLNEAMVKVLTDPVTVKKFADLTAEAKPSTPEELRAMLDVEDRTAVPLIKKLGIKPE